MCGIAGTIYRRDYQPGVWVDTDDLFGLLEQIENGSVPSSSLLDMAWKYKSNINFIRYCKSSSEREKISLLCDEIFTYSEKRKTELPLIDKSASLDLYKSQVKEWECLVDAHWFFSNELNKTKDLVESLAELPSIDISDSSLVLFRDITKIIHAIDNRLELRGRDSFGLSITLSSPHFSSEKIDGYRAETNREEVFYSQGKEAGTYSFVFKACNSIGGLGDNANEIKELIKGNELFLSLAKGGQVSSATIMGHTRWASVGEVSFGNTHPIGLIDSSVNEDASHVLSCLNGDIYNYKEIIADAKNTQVLSTDESICTSDCLAASAFLLGKKDVSIDTISQMAVDFIGSFAIAIQHSDTPEKLFLVKKGIQGLYLGFSYDGVLFASDVYGLVETCRYFVPVESDVALELSTSNLVSALDPQVSILNLQTDIFKNVTTDDLKITNITTRDIDKRGYTHFLEKEIYETKDIVERTLNSYLQPEKCVDQNSLHSAFNITPSQIPPFIIEKFKNREIKKVVITGMGTCYTAAVAISMYMRDALKAIIPDILVEPHVASEGSAFYVEPDMQDTLVIVIAQSGTTVDTNVYVQMAKERGACSLAIANKREGDVTFIVDGTSYIGEGRDIEVAVPSTKTYTAQVALGYIVSAYLACNIAETESDKQRLLQDIKSLRCLVGLIEESFSVIDAFPDFGKMTKSALKYNSWYVLRDGSTNAVCADEIRIKYSENCYHSVASITLGEANALEVKNSFVTLITEAKLSYLAPEITDLLGRENSVTIISVNGGEIGKLQALIDGGTLFIVPMPAAPKYFSFIPTIIAGQFLSYFQAIELDKRTQYFSRMIESLDAKLDFMESISDLGEAIKAGYLNQGYSVIELHELHHRLERYVNGDGDENIRKEVKNSLTRLAELSRRTIDTIKHQAKTITVGAVRDSSSESTRFVASPLITSETGVSNDLKLSSLTLLNDDLLASLSGYENLNLLGDVEILISFQGLDESIAYNVINYINEYAGQLGVQQKIRLAQPYDYQQKDNVQSEYWIILSDGDYSDSYTHLSKDQYLLFDFAQWEPGEIIRSCFGSAIDQRSNYTKAIWSFLLGILLSRKLVLGDGTKTNKSDDFVQRIDSDTLKELDSLIRALSYIETNELIEHQVTYAAKMFLTRKNWKSIGSGANYNSAKYAAKHLIRELGRACAFDVLENHKHIDMSAESAILVFISGIWKHGYQEDALSELKKMLAHNSLPIILTDLNDNRFDNYSVLVVHGSGETKEVGVPVIKLPRVSLQYSYPLNVLLLDKITEALKLVRDSKSSDLSQILALVSADSELANANLWK